MQMAERRLPDLQKSREWLIVAGQIEQAVLDAGLNCGKRATETTMAAADVFLDAVSGDSSSARRSAAQLRLALEILESELDGCDLDFRVPEGFAWYALYPDSYVQTARSWARHIGQADGDVCVIGLRSIGTALAAVVAGSLRRSGLTVARCVTVRPSGDPFDRRAELPSDLAPARHNIIVDEGPGLSGSSMAGVARALRDAGADAESVHLFAGHGNGPGPAVSKEAKCWWRAHRVWATDLDSTLIGARLLPDALAWLAEDCAGEPATAPAGPLGTLGWAALSGLPAPPRAVAPMLETPKRLVLMRSGRHVLLRFAGLALDGRASWCGEQRVTGGAGDSSWLCRDGWVAMPWLEGVRLTVGDAEMPFLANHLGPWIAAASTQDLQPGDVCDGIHRIAAALVDWARTREPVLVSAIERMAERQSAQVGSAPQPAYGDGRLAPHEWIRLADGTLRKLDAWGHDTDHTWVGPQPVVWDLVGAETEWHLDVRRAEALRSVVHRLTGYSCSDEAHAFYTAGYCVFRAAAACLCARSSHDEGIRSHLLKAGRWYEKRLVAVLTSLRAVAPKPAHAGVALARPRFCDCSNQKSPAA